MPSQHKITTGPFYCVGYTNIKLKFARWLNINKLFYSDVVIQVSNDGMDWSPVWSYDESWLITDDQWKIMEYDIYSFAANE